MRLSTKSRYGLRALFDMAYNCGTQSAQVQDISRRQQISPRYLEQIFQNLKQAGILKSKRGPNGGYSLARTPDQITVLEIIKATEQDVLMVDCAGEGKRSKRRKNECPFEGNCVTQTVWKDANDLLEGLFGSLTLATLCQRGAEMGLPREQDQRMMYYI
ncbi:RrF2 family transcriptional regulator [Trichlorobacter ammonificans]|uniref:Transcriptional regulator, BadM/Rrf2 family n=1 Tax=Trichlorobacter ammonificans TaxID=2916410 RepID=A0ABN8HKJ2_9BACT|nr:RrF2 family transcriptional regulator [Trichlorobacter ammonificans]CAH2030462.1 Transcriptional regulator, BadM/Rrf2 family [Trichlorobacter ammonificans]